MVYFPQFFKSFRDILSAFSVTTLWPIKLGLVIVVKMYLCEKSWSNLNVGKSKKQPGHLDVFAAKDAYSCLGLVLRKSWAGAFLVGQCLRIHLPMQGTQV